ncbi:ABC transporter ATP-binding protein [Candidatus Sumerlaeota bacterium]|nr:ABC transporter ATP-binding protein [Candidatus Sumerlaeota bacterium]
MSVIKVTALKKVFYDGPRVLEILKRIDLEVQAGESVAIMGASGAGKSTLLHLLGALDQPTAGEIVLDDVPYTSLNPHELAAVRNKKIGFIFQFHYLLPEFTALENVMIPALINNQGRHRSAEIREKAGALLEQVGLGERLNHRPAKLSGGEQQRVALCRALINEPLVVLADEPTGDLDLATGDEMIHLIWEQTVAKGKSLVIVTHNPDIAQRAVKIFHLHQGVLHLVEKT